MVSNWFTGLRSKNEIALEIIRTICIRCNCNQSVECSWFLLILIINESPAMNTRTKTIGKDLLPCPAVPLELLLFSVFSKIMIGCFVVGCVVGGDLKVQVFEPVAEVPLSPSIIGLFCHFPSHPATSLPQAVAIIVSHWEAEVERKIISLIVSRIKFYVWSWRWRFWWIGYCKDSFYHWL